MRATFPSCLILLALITFMIFCAACRLWRSSFICISTTTKPPHSQCKLLPRSSRSTQQAAVQHSSVFTKLRAFPDTRNCNEYRQLGETQNVTHCRSVRTGFVHFIQCLIFRTENNAWQTKTDSVCRWRGGVVSTHCPAGYLLPGGRKKFCCRNVGLCKECKEKIWSGNRAVIILWRNIDRTVRIKWQLTIYLTNQPINQPTNQPTNQSTNQPIN